MIYDLLPEYLQYWSAVGFSKFFRVFWHFLVFEFFRYFVIDFIVLMLYESSNKERQKRYEKARAELRLENPLISIIVPGKNEGKNFYSLVKTLSEQTISNFEIIVIDDGSDDDSYLIGKDLEKNGLIDLFLSNTVRGGKASAANLGVAFAKGKYIVHLDADCSFDRDAIENILLPFYMEKNIGGVGGNVKVRNADESLATKMQAIEYCKTISVSRIVTSYLGIYKIISGAFGAFRTDVVRSVGGWDIGPGLDGDITVKIRKSGYKVRFEHTAVCLTSVPNSFQRLSRQRLRWSKSIVRFRLRKHKNVYSPNANFRWSNFFALSENVFYNLILDFLFIIYIVDVTLNYTSTLHWVFALNYTLYTTMNFLQMAIVLRFSERSREEKKYLWYIPLISFYTGEYLRTVRSIAYLKELLFKSSYNDPWNPEKSSKLAKEAGI